MLLAPAINSANRLPNIDGIFIAWALKTIDPFLLGKWGTCLVVGAKGAAMFLAGSGAGIYASLIQTPADFMEKIAR